MNNRHLVSRVCRPVFVAAVALALALSAGCSAAGNDDDASTVLAPLASMPQEVQDAPVPVQEAYRFVVAHPHLMTQIPCYCGCGSMGHTSNYACYASGTDEAGNILFDSHALGCSICVDITLDARHLFEQGKPAEEIRAYIDDVYSPYGPSNMP